MNDLKLNRVTEIVSLHAEIVGFGRMALDRAIRIGELLTEQKAELGHGDFGPWIQEHLPFTDRTARRYMLCYEHRDRLKTDTMSDLTGAYRLLRQPQLPAADVVSDEQAIEAVTAAQDCTTERLVELRRRLDAVSTIPPSAETAKECAAIAKEAAKLKQGVSGLNVAVRGRLADLLRCIETTKAAAEALPEWMRREKVGR